MYLMNYHLYANEASMPRVLAEDAGAADFCWGWPGRDAKVSLAVCDGV